MKSYHCARLKHERDKSKRKDYERFCLEELSKKNGKFFCRYHGFDISQAEDAPLEFETL